MNKIFKVVFNAARMKYMVVNEMTSSIGPSKNSVISMAVATALTCTSAIAATITDVDGTFTALSDDATIIYGDRTVHSNSLYSAGYHFVTIPADPTNPIDVNIKIRNTSNYLSIGATDGTHSERGTDVVLETLGDLTIQPGSLITNFKEGDVFRAKNITLGLVTNTSATQAGGVIEASDTLTFTNNFTVYGATVAAQTIEARLSTRFNGQSEVNAPTIRVTNSMDLYGQTQVSTNDFAIGGTLTLGDDAKFTGAIPKVTFLAKDGTTNAPRIQLMGTQPIAIGELIVEKTPGVGVSANEAMLTDKMTTNDVGVTSFTIDKLTMNEGSALSVYADSKNVDAPLTNIQIGTADLADEAKLNLGYRSTDFDSELGEKRIRLLILGQDASVTVKSGTNPDGLTPLINNADVSIEAIALMGSDSTIDANLVGTRTNVLLKDGVNGTRIASSSVDSLNVFVENPITSDMTLGQLDSQTQVSITTLTDFNTGHPKNDLQQLADAVKITSMNDAYVAVSIDETDVFGAMSGQVDSNGRVIFAKEAVNTKTKAIGESLTVMPTMMTRMMNDDVRQRLGNIRASVGESGVWVRYNAGNLHGRGLDTDFNMVQIGVDTTPMVHAMRFGVAFAYGQSETTATLNNDSDQYSLAGYGLWQGQNGEFIDVIARMASIKTDWNGLKGQKVGVDNLALSLSGEYGWRWNVTDMFFVEPSMDMTYTYVDSDNFTMGKVRYSMDSVDSLVARVGLASGLKCANDMGEVYLRVGVAYEFLGDSTLKVNGGIRSYETKGDDTWVEYAIGTNFNLTKNMYVYADIERTSGGDVDEDWRANVGFRYAF